MAIYVRDNYSNFLNSGRKINFLRQMRTDLGIDCDDDKKLTNAFADFVKKYTDVKSKLNSSGFGIDPDKDKTLNKGWVLKQCPYFDILDEVMGCRPNVTPPAVVSTAVATTEHDGDEANENDMLSDADDADGVNSDEENVAPTNDHVNAADPLHQNHASELQDDADVPRDKDDVSKFVKEAFRGLRPVKSKCRDPVGAYAEVMNERMKLNAELKKGKLKLDEKRYQDDLQVRKERNEIEKLKVDSQIEIERQKLQMDKDRLADKAADREHELTKLRLQQEFELKKLQLQLQYKQA